MNPTAILRAAAIAFCAGYFALMVALSLASRAQTIALFESQSPGLLWLLVALATFECLSSFRRSARANARPFLARIAVSAAVGAVVAAFVTATVPVRFKLYYDEVELLATANALSDERAVRIADMGLFTLGSWDTISYAPSPWRPLLFPFLTHVVQGLFGVGALAPFVVNSLVLAALVAVIFVWVWRVLDVTSAAAAVLLVIGCPVISIWATSGGFDLLSCLLSVATLAALRRFQRDPSADALSLLGAFALLLCHTRHESIALGALALCIAVATPGFRLAMIAERPLVWAAAPALLLPVAWLRFLATARTEETGGSAPFSLAHFWTHARHLGLAVTRVGGRSPYPTLAIWGGIASTALVLRHLVRQRHEGGAARTFRWIFGGGVVALISVTALHLAHFSGDPLAPASSRFFLLPCLGLVLAPVVLRSIVPRSFSAHAIVLYAAAAAVLYHPVSTRDRVSAELLTTRELNWVLQSLREFDPGRTLVIAPVPMVFSAVRYGAVSFAYANESDGAILRGLERHAYDHVVVFQELDYRTGEPLPGQRLASEFKLASWREMQVGPRLWARISLVTATMPVD